MTARQQWSQGLQWGACAWLCYVIAHTVLDLVDPAWRDNPQGWTLPRFHLETGWPAGSWLTAALWLAAAVMVAAGARRARPAVAAAILAQTALGLLEASHNPPGADAPLGLYSQVALALGLFLPVCLPALPLAFLRVERPRTVVSLLAKGRWHDAWSRSGGPGVLMVALAVLWLHVGLRDLLVREREGFSVVMDLVGEYGGMRLFRTWWLVTAIFVALASVAVWASASARCARCERS